MNIEEYLTQFESRLRTLFAAYDDLVLHSPPKSCGIAVAQLSCNKAHSLDERARYTECRIDQCVGELREMLEQERLHASARAKLTAEEYEFLISLYD